MTQKNTASGRLSLIIAAIALMALVATALPVVLSAHANRAYAAELSVATISDATAQSERPSPMKTNASSAVKMSGAYKYKVNADKTVTIIKYVGSKDVKSLIIPKRLGGKRVTIIGKGAFQGLEKLRKVTIPKGVTRVKAGAFNGCWNVRYLKLPSTLKRVDDYAFHGCQVKNLKLPDKLAKIGGQPFAYTQCVTLPKSFKTFDWSWFASGDGTCTLSSIKMAKGNKHFSFQNGILYNKNKTSIVYHLVIDRRTSFKVPNSVRTICDGAFSWSFGLQRITLGKNVTSIGSGAFMGTRTGEEFAIPASAPTRSGSS